MTATVALATFGVAVASVAAACGGDDAPAPGVPGSSGASSGASASGSPAGDGGDAAPAPPFDGGGVVAAWRDEPPLPSPQQENAVVALGGKIYVIGGFGPSPVAVTAVTVYDPATKAWTAAKPLPEPIHHVNAVTVGNRIVVAGALQAAASTATGTTLIYDPARDEWTAKTPMPSGTERGSSFIGAIGDIVYVAGGIRTGSVADVSAYDTVKDSWSPLAAMPAGRDHGMSAVIEGRLYAIGGRNGGGHVARVDVFDPRTNAWSSRAPMPTSRGGGMAALAKGVVVVAGGEGNVLAPDGMFGETEAYDPVKDTWFSLPRMKTPRHGTGAVEIGGIVYVPGGGTVAGLGQSTVMESLAF